MDENLAEKDFQKTICFAHIKGSLEVASEVSIGYGLAVIASLETCRELRETIESFSKELCIPDDLTPYQIARDYVKFVESKEYKPYHRNVMMHDGMDEAAKEKIMAEATKKYYQSPADLYFQIYSCKPKPNGKIPDVR